MNIKNKEARVVVSVLTSYAVSFVMWYLFLYITSNGNIAFGGLAAFSNIMATTSAWGKYLRVGE